MLDGVWGIDNFMVFKLRLVIGAGLLLLILAGCRGYHAAPEVPPFQVPNAFGASGNVTASVKWWYSFKDSLMWRAVNNSLNSNFTIKSAFERIKMAKAILQKARAPLLPWIDAESSLSHRTIREGNRYVNLDQILLNANVSYEIDLWGRINSGVEAARLELAAQKADFQTAILSLSSQVASSYFEIVALRQEKRYIRRQIERNKASLKIIEEKYRFGQTDVLDLLQQKQLVEQNISNAIDVDKALATVAREFAVLLGVPTSSQLTVETAESLPVLPPLPATGLPMELIKRRPDCLRAFLKLKAANARLAEAVSSQYPRLAIGGSVESSSSALKDLLENWIASIAANVVVPIFEGGRLEAEVRLREAEAKRLLYEYGQTLLNAIKEVDETLEIERRQKALIKNLRSRLELARNSSLLLKEKYLAGDVEYLRFLASQISVDELERQLVRERLKLIQNRIRLYKAIAGPVDPDVVEFPNGPAETSRETR